ncbi:hypothetical protein BAE44_0000745 [Dichanthelium oligosanthes]|uniref:Gnk2-homologous domain-containing protein n=1 Tax=Dichanthelium oligosanthes TaxID=888268 RepID=A0A1E5WLG6_9POAL|nr:hypothetical protein BAE44_0000745 [Dichanthelium oligosanthes]
MASPKLPDVSSLLVLVLVTSGPGIAIALKLEPDGTSRHFPPLIDCAPAHWKNDDGSPFRANVLSLLAALPSAAAAAPTGFAATRSGGAPGRDRAFARGHCFGLGASTSPGDCLECLSAAAQDVAIGCPGSRRAAVWRAGCFLSYADTNASTGREDAFRDWFYADDDGVGPTAALGSQCLGDRTAAECSRCANDSAGVVPALNQARKLSRVRGHYVVVVGYTCYLRVPLFVPSPRWMSYVTAILLPVEVIFVEVCGVMCCIRKAREMNPA